MPQTGNLKPADFCLHTALARAAAEYPSKNALIAGRAACSYATIRSLAYPVARALLTAGIQPEDRVIIKSRGEKVSPIEGENVFYGIPGIVSAAVVGTPDPIVDSAIVACWVKAADSPLTETDVRRVCGSKLENFMVPSRFIFVDDMPKTNTGKVSKKELKALLNL